MIEKEQPVKTAITIWEAKEKRSHETIYKTDTKKRDYERQHLLLQS